MSDRQIDSVTGDLVSGPKGTFGDVDVLQNKILFSNTIALGSWEGDPLIGHRFAELARVTDSDDARRRLPALVVAAVQWLLDSGELVQVVVTVIHYDRGVVAFEADYYPPTGAAIAVKTALVPLGSL